MEKDLHVQLLIILLEALHWRAALSSDSKIFYILTEELAETLRDAFAKVRIHGE